MQGGDGRNNSRTYRVFGYDNGSESSTVASGVGGGGQLNSENRRTKQDHQSVIALSVGCVGGCRWNKIVVLVRTEAGAGR